MDTSLYFPPYTHTQNTSSDELNTTHNKGSLLLNTEPRDLDKLFHRTSFQQKPEEDICFPPNNRPSVSSNESTLDDRHKNKTIPKNNNGNSSFEDINLNALYELMQKRKEQPYSPGQSPVPGGKNQGYTIHSIEEVGDADKAQRHLLSLYGDNTLTCNHQQKYSQYPPQTTKDENRFMYYHPDTGSLLGPTLQEISLPPQMTLEGLLLKENYWIDVTAPTNEEMIMLSKMFHIHPLTTEDIMSYEIREKCDVFRHYMFVCYRAFLHDIQQLKPVTFYNIVTKKHTLTFHFEQVPHVGNVQQRVKQLQDYIEIVPDWINYALIDEITDSFAPIIQQIESEVDAIDDSVLLYKVDQTDVVLRIGTCRKKVIQMVRLLGTKVEVVRGLMKRILENRHACQDVVFDELTDGKIYPDVELYLGDVQDHILTMVQNLNHYETVLARSESNYLARISIQLTETSNSTNHVIGRLTIFATVMLPMNLITGLWGMNVKVPGKDYDNLVYFFWIVISLVVFAIFSLTLAKRLKFI